MTHSPILCAVDFSEQSRHALRWAGALAARYACRLTVLNVVDPLLAEAARMRLGQDLAKDETEPALRDFFKATWTDGAATPSDVAFAVRIGDPAHVILETAASEAAGLIVVGTQGLRGVQKWVLGSTTERVLRRTQAPVFAVPSAGTESGAVRAAEEAGNIDHVLAATDFSESSFAAVEYAARLAGMFAAKLSLLHVVEPLSVPPHWQALAELSDEARVTEARAQLKALGERCCGSRDHEAIVAEGFPADVIPCIAGEHRAALIVMGLSGGSGPLSPRPGSIAYRVLCATTVPVLVVPPSPAKPD